MSMSTSKTRPAMVDSTQAIIQRNDRIREKHLRDITKIRSEAQRSHDELAKQIGDLQKEIRDIHAYTAVYRDNSLVRIEEQRKKKSSISSEQTSEAPKTTTTLKKPKVKLSSVATMSDPFHLKSCLIDVDFRMKEAKQQSLPMNNEPVASTRKRLKRASTAVITRAGNENYESLLPGKCTTYYSIRKFYEQEKDKLLHKWSPEERRRKTVQWILENNSVPQFATVRRATTSAIFRDFHKYRSKTDIASEQLSLPSIDNDSNTPVPSI